MKWLIFSIILLAGCSNAITTETPIFATASSVALTRTPSNSNLATFVFGTASAQVTIWPTAALPTSTSTPIPSSTLNTPTQEVCLVLSTVNVGSIFVRSAPSTSASVMGGVLRGDVVVHELYNPSNQQGIWEWVRIARGDLAGNWIVRNLLTEIIPCLLGS